MPSSWDLPALATIGMYHRQHHQHSLQVSYHRPQHGATRNFSLQHAGGVLGVPAMTHTGCKGQRWPPCACALVSTINFASLRCVLAIKGVHEQACKGGAA